MKKKYVCWEDVENELCLESDYADSLEKDMGRLKNDKDKSLRRILYLKYLEEYLSSSISPLIDRNVLRDDSELESFVLPLINKEKLDELEKRLKEVAE